ncbi:type IV secretory system conjugative DNA transfer family protein [Rhodococcus opacus]
MRREMWPPIALTVLCYLVIGGIQVNRWHEQGAPWWLLITGAVLVGGALVAAGVWWWHKVRDLSAEQKMRDVRKLDDYTGKGAAQKGLDLRQSLEDSEIRDVAMDELAVSLGRVGRTILYKSWEDVCLAFMGPRSNKTSAIAVPTVLKAPGPVVATSNKPDLWMLTSGLRARVGRIYTFDPSQIAYVPQQWWWNPLAGITDIDDAEDFAAQFVMTVSVGERDIWGPGAKSLLGQLFLAASISGGGLREAMAWLYTGSSEPVGILEKGGHLMQAAKLATTLEGAAETRSGLVMTASEAVSCLASEKVLRWVTPPQTWRERPTHTIEEIDLWQFVTPHPDGRYPTLYLLTQEGAGSAGPIVAALVDRLFRTAKKAASALGGRLDPVLTVMLDEAANICRIANLPAYYSWFGSVGVSVTTLLQSYAQGEGVWSKTGMETLYNASTLNLIGAGIKDISFARNMSASVGEHLVKRATESYGPGGSSTSVSQVREAIMPPEDVINLPRTKAVWHVTGHRPVLMDLMPWYREDSQSEITTHSKQAAEQIRLHAIEALGPDNPISQYLTCKAKPVTAAETEAELL